MQPSDLEQEARDLLNEVAMERGIAPAAPSMFREDSFALEAVCRALEQREGIPKPAPVDPLVKVCREIGLAPYRPDELRKALAARGYTIAPTSQPNRAHDVMNPISGSCIAPATGQAYNAAAPTGQPTPVDPLEAWLRTKMGDPAPQFAKALRQAFRVEPLEHAMTSQPDPQADPDEVALLKRKLEQYEALRTSIDPRAALKEPSNGG